MNLDFADIALVRAISESGSLSRACEKLNLSQPTLSKKLARLEDRLKTKLFYRSSKGLVPTKVVNYMLRKVEPLNAGLAEIERHIELMTQLEVGSIKIGAGPILEQILLPDTLIQFLSEVGQVSISIITESADALLALLNEAKVDVVVGPFAKDDYKTGETLAIPLVKDRFVAVARPEHPIFDRADDCENAIREYPLAIPRTRGSVEGDVSLLQRRSDNILSDNYNLLKRITSKSDAICFGPCAIFSTELDSGALRLIDIDLSLIWESVLLVRAESLETPLVKRLVDIFTNVSQQYLHDH